MPKLKLEDYLGDIEVEDENIETEELLQDHDERSMLDDKKNLFTEINVVKGYAVPTEFYWDIWHSDQKDLLHVFSFSPHKAEYGWVVRLPCICRDMQDRRSVIITTEIIIHLADLMVENVLQARKEKQSLMEFETDIAV
ncbi:hypothetical protein F4X73_13260 [Candidatus Poribacteria bacterium]|nr:hypothetical protein [Candidatus Poribacteria bacterium]